MMAGGGRVNDAVLLMSLSAGLALPSNLADRRVLETAFHDATLRTATSAMPAVVGTMEMTTDYWLYSYLRNSR